MNKKRKQYIVFCVVLIALLLPPLIALAVVYYSVQRTNNFKPAEADIRIVESNSSGDELEKEYTFSQTNDVYSVDKPAAVYDVRNKNDEYLRVQFVPMWYDEDGFVCGSITVYKEITQEGNILICRDNNGAALITLYLASDWRNNWEYKSDGFFYYNGPISSDKTTPDLLTKVEISSEVYDSVKDDYKLRIDVLADAVQLSGEAASHRDWN